MNITAWRIFKKKHRASAFSGAGARLYGGRWNSKGVAVIYASASPSLAALEMLVHLQMQEILQAYWLAPISFDESMVEDVLLADLPAKWHKESAPAALQAIGDDWITGASSVVLRVPSAVIATESNYLLNPHHPDFTDCTRGKPRPFRFDPRLAK